MIGLFVLITGVLWVLLTDELLYQLVHDPQTVARLETAKGWFYVAAVSFGAYVAASIAFGKITRSEAALRAILDSIADGVLLWGGPNRGVIDANPAAVRMLGVSRREELLGLSLEGFSRLFHPCTPDGRLIPPHLYPSQRALQGETVADGAAIVVHPPSGLPLTLHVIGAPVRMSPGGPVVLAVSVLRDVTAHTKLERMRDRFFAAAAHSLKTPVAVIKARAQLLLRSRDLNAVGREGAEAIDRQCSRIDQLVQNLLVLSRLTSKSLELQMQDIELAMFLEEVVADERSRIGAAVNLEVEAEPHVFGDVERLKLVTRNLIEAAVRSSLPGRTVSVRLTKRDGAARVAIVAPPAYGSEEYSYQDEAAVALEVSRKIVDAHSGKSDLDLSVHSRLVWFELPIADVSPRREGAEQDGPLVARR